MHDLLQVFQQLGQGHGDQDFVNIELRLSKPSKLEYTIRTFVQEKEGTEPNLFRKRMALYHGVDWNYNYEMVGKINYPEEFKGMECHLEVNPLAGSDYLEYGPQGLLGNGWVERNCLNFVLYLAPQAARDIIERQLLEDRLQTSDSVPQEGSAWMWLGIHVVDYKYGDRVPYEDKITFRIVRVYC